jgi:hypothetical protein
MIDAFALNIIELALPSAVRRPPSSNVEDVFFVLRAYARNWRSIRGVVAGAERSPDE